MHKSGSNKGLSLGNGGVVRGSVRGVVRSKVISTLLFAAYCLSES